MTAAHGYEPAFPVNELSQVTGDICAQHFGLTLRDYFAVHADIGDVDELSVPVGVILLGRDVPEFKKDQAGCYEWWAEYRAKLRYMEADAMMKARSA